MVPGANLTYKRTKSSLTLIFPVQDWCNRRNRHRTYTTLRLSRIYIEAVLLYLYNIHTYMQVSIFCRVYYNWDISYQKTLCNLSVIRADQKRCNIYVMSETVLRELREYLVRVSEAPGKVSLAGAALICSQYTQLWNSQFNTVIVRKSSR